MYNEHGSPRTKNRGPGYGRCDSGRAPNPWCIGGLDDSGNSCPTTTEPTDCTLLTVLGTGDDDRMVVFEVLQHVRNGDGSRSCNGSGGFI